MERDQASKFINDLLKLMVSRNGSDLFITAEFPPAIKIDGKVTKVSPQPLSQLHTLALARSIMNDKQVVDNGLGMTMIPEMAVQSGILDGTQVHAHPLQSDHDSRTIALVWRRNSPREKEFQLLAEIMRQFAPTPSAA